MLYTELWLFCSCTYAWNIREVVNPIRGQIWFDFNGINRMNGAFKKIMTVLFLKDYMKTNNVNFIKGQGWFDFYDFVTINSCKMV